MTTGGRPRAERRRVRAVAWGVAALAALGCLACAEPRPVPTVFPLPAPWSDVSLDYLPFEYLPDGCSQRASYVAMELALRGVPTVAVDAEDCDFEMGLHGPFGEPWRHHVVPAVFDAEGQLALMDPLASPSLLTLPDWLAGLTDDEVRVFVTSSAYPTSHGHESECGSVETEVDPVPATVAEMTPWLLENVMSDCAALRQFHRDSPVYDPAREQRLVERTAQLVLAMHDLGLIDESMGPTRVDDLRDAPACPEPVPK